MQLSNRLRRLRNRFGYSQAALAKALAVSRMAYTQYESGHREPSLHTLILLTQIYGVSLDYLAGLSDLSHLPELSDREKFLLSQLDRLADDRRQNVFQALQHQLGEQILSDSQSYREGFSRVILSDNPENPSQSSRHSVDESQ
ncbi:MAG: helix-turn-helix transcriptional regulator [Lachnospiraceae bacterium]|jgi:transcriptional regulator with XRE-family HTH domain|nr:helix-turn-helix transcriptional regulator [Lachnospiraceae bacterium]